MRFKLKYLSFLGIIIFIWLLSRIDFAQLLTIFEKMNFFFLIVAFLISTAGLITNFLRWHYLLTCLGISLSRVKAIEFSFQSLFAEHTPGKVGEPILKAVYLNKYAKSSLPNSLFSTIFHKFIDIWSAVIQSIIVVVVLFFLFKINLTIIIPTVIFFSLIIVGLFVLVYNKKLTTLIVRPLFRMFVPKKYKEKVKINLIEFYNNFEKINKRVLLVSFLYDLVVVLITAISFYFIMLSIGQNIPFIHLIMVVPLLTIGVGLPISIAGIGIREAIFVFYFSLLEISSEIGIAFGIILLLFRIVSLIPGLIISSVKK
jgi:hypothetical protein